MATLLTSTKLSVAPGRRYHLTDAFFDKAIKGAIQDSLFSPVSLGERHDVRLKPAFNTACWAYLPPHQIFVGTDLFEKPSVREGLTEKQQAKYVANHYHHELGHALYTERDMAKVNAALKKISAPFSLFNLFEDAAMERRYCLEAEYRFDWLSLETLEVGARPESALFALIQAEGAVAVVKAALEANASSAAGVSNPEAVTALDQFPKVLKFYERIVGTSSTMLLMPVIADWLAEFGLPPKPPAPKAGEPGEPGQPDETDLALSAKLMESAAFAQAFGAGCTAVKPVTEPGFGGGGPAKAVPASIATAVARKGQVLQYASALDQPRAERLAQRFAKLFKATTRMASTATPQKRLSARNLCLGRPFYKRKELEQKAKKNLFMVIDCSGSMQGSHMTEGRLMVAAMSLLAKQGLVSGHVVLSAVLGNTPVWETFKLPMAVESIERIQAFASAEGLADAVQDNIKLAQQADYVFVYTDGQICDRPINKSAFHKQGVYTWGLYAGEDESCLAELIKYFDKAVMRKTAEDLVDAMLAQLK